ncbi:hypothetical protein ACFSQ7_18495 [Paenibacillus rhizoplanae]
MAGSGIPYVLESALGSIAEELDCIGPGKPPVWLLGELRIAAAWGSAECCSARY